MGRAAMRIGRWKVVWPLVLLALMVRIGFGSLATPAMAVEGVARQRVLHAVFCKGDPGTGVPRPRPPADAGDGLLLLGDALAMSALLDVRLVTPLSGPSGNAATPTWSFPPVRGPPARISAALYAQGPPYPT